MNEDPYATLIRPIPSPVLESSTAPTLILSTARYRVTVAGRSDSGRKRRNNEDDFLIDRDRNLFAVFDGMGGMAAGEIASAEAKRGFIDVLSLTESSELPPGDLLRRCLTMANQRIVANAFQNRQRAGMGSTAVAVALRGQAMHLLSLGDSRLYQIPVGGDALPLTRDHSLVALLVENGEMTAEEARTSPLKNQLLGVLGEPVLPEPFTGNLAVCVGQRFVLCSDGLWDMLSDREIGQTSRQATTPEQAVEYLIAAANAAGGHDNITVIVLDIGDSVSG